MRRRPRRHLIGKPELVSSYYLYIRMRLANRSGFRRFAQESYLNRKRVREIVKGHSRVLPSAIRASLIPIPSGERHHHRSQGGGNGRGRVYTKHRKRMCLLINVICELNTSYTLSFCVLCRRDPVSSRAGEKTKGQGKSVFFGPRVPVLSAFLLVQSSSNQMNQIGP